MSQKRRTILNDMTETIIAASRWRIAAALAGAVACALAFAWLWPNSREAGAILIAQNDPVELSNLQVKAALRGDPNVVAQNIDAALQAKDADLANSFVELAAAHGIAVSARDSVRVAEAVAEENSASHLARRFVTGFVTGNADDVASLSGTVAGDLFVFGDIRDVVREGKRLAMGEDADRLILGLAATGLAVTAATYVSLGGAVPIRAGLTLVKDARKVGRLGAGLTEWAGRSARGVVDGPMLQKAVVNGSLARPGQTVSAIRAAFQAEKAGALVRVAKDVGRISEKTGARGALDALRVAEGPKDIARAARLAESKGGQTRAIVKLLGRGALLLSVGAFNLTMWIFGALLTLVGFICSIKATTERLTQSLLNRAKAKRARRTLRATLTAQPPLASIAAAA